MEPVLTVENLRVRFHTHDGMVEAVKGASFTVHRGETLAIVGESGSGKSQTMMAAMGLLAANGEASGSVRFAGTQILRLPAKALNAYRGRRIGMVFQEPMTSLDPLFRIGEQLLEPIVHHQRISRKAAMTKALELLQLVQIPEPQRRMRAYPHELSGGQRQRIMIALAIANNPDLLIADEPTTALDVTIQAEILALLKSLQQRLGMALVFITHDLGIVRRIADRVMVMQQGEVVETADCGTIFVRPQHPYTKALLASEPAGHKAPPPPDAQTILRADKIGVTYQLRGGFLARPMELRAVDDVSLSVRRGQTVGIVGESGSGKSTLARAILRLVPSRGKIEFRGSDISRLDKRQMRPLRRHMQIVAQDPFGSLSPRMTCGQIVAEGLLVHEPAMPGVERERAIAAAFTEVGLDPALRNRYPHEFSGGQRQRIAIARAIILKPELVVLDEPTSSLDRQVQKQVVELLRELQRKHGLSYIFISHDLALVRAMADHVLVMRDGKVVEEGSAGAIFQHPQEVYTQRLLAAAFGEIVQGEHSG